MEIDHCLLEAMREVDALYPANIPIAPLQQESDISARYVFLQQTGAIYLQSVCVRKLRESINVRNQLTHLLNDAEVASMRHTQWNLLRWQLGWRP